MTIDYPAPKWLLSADMVRRCYEGGQILPALERAGIQYHLFEGDSREEIQLRNFYHNLQPSLKEHFVVWGDRLFCQGLRTQAPFQVFAHGLTDRTRFSWWAPRLRFVNPHPELSLLNDDYVLVPWMDLIQRRAGWLSVFPGEGLFVRPDSGFKTFSGQPVKYSEWEDHLTGIDATSAVMDDTLCVVASLKPVEAEFRFIVANRQVVAGSEYRYDGRLDVRRDYPETCYSLAWKVAKSPHQPDLCYTVDVALVDEQPRLVELNSFCCAGLYACDMDPLVAGVQAATVWEIADRNGDHDV